MEKILLEVTQICRLCLCEEKLQPVSDSELAPDFNNFSFIEPVLNHKLPEAVCGQCLEELTRIGLFIKKCRESHDTLTQMKQETEKVGQRIMITAEMLDHIGYIKTEGTHLKLEESALSSWETGSDCGSNVNIATSDSNISNEIMDGNTSEYNMNFVELAILNEQPSKADVKNCSGTHRTIKTCGKCGDVTTKLVDHYKVSKGCSPTNVKCEICKLGCKCAAALERHKVVHHWNQVSQNNAMCHICSKMFKHEHNLRRHILVHEYGKRFICEVCGKQFTTKTVLKDHYNLHTGEKPYCCCYCGKTYTTAASCTLHEMGHRKIETNPNWVIFMCEICSREFSKMHFLKLHMRSHDDNTLYRCKACKQKFETSLLFRKHLATHFFERQHSCSYCYKRFSERHLRIRHARIHTGERPFVCTVCNKAFSQEAHLKRHTLSMHEKHGEKPFKCKICEQRFTEKCSLTVHLRLHSGERPYLCHICQKDFIDSGSRRRHVKLFHGEEELKNIDT